jgi:hypothetical protein
MERNNRRISKKGLNLKIKIHKSYEKNFFEILQKAIKNLDDLEYSEFKWVKEYQSALLHYLEDLIDNILIGLTLKLHVDPKEVKKSFRFSMYNLLKAYQNDIGEDELLLKSLWTELRDKYKKAIKKYKKFNFAKKPLEPMQIKNKVLYNPEKKELMTNSDWLGFEKDVVNYFKDSIDLEDETIVRAGLFGLLRMKMDKEGIPVKKQRNMSYDEVIDHFGEEINEPSYIKREISKNEKLKQSIKFAKENAAKYLAIDGRKGEVYDRIVDIVRKQIVSGLGDGITKQQMISRLYHVDLDDELGKDLNQYTRNAYNRDLRRIVLTEFNMAFSNGLLAAELDDSKETKEKKYFVYAGQYNPKEKANEPCNIWLGRVCLLVDEPKNNDKIKDEYAEFAIWVGKDAVGKKWIAIPSHPHCTHYWERFYPEFQQWNSETNSIEWKVEKSFEDEKLNLIKNDPIKKEIKWKGFNIGIEWEKGEIREYPGSPYKNLMQYDYGYIKNTDSPDGEEIDVCINKPIKQKETIYLLFQKQDGKYDELKFGIGFSNAGEFRNKYEQTMTKNMFGGIIPMTLEKFKDEMKFFWKKKNLVKSITFDDMLKSFTDDEEMLKALKTNVKYIRKEGVGRNAKYIYKKKKMDKNSFHDFMQDQAKEMQKYKDELDKKYGYDTKKFAYLEWIEKFASDFKKKWFKQHLVLDMRG